MEKTNETKVLSFEESLMRLAEIVKQMESGQTPLDEMLSLFEEGTRLVKVCSKMLSEAEQKVVILTKGKEGELYEQDFGKAE